MNMRRWVAEVRVWIDASERVARLAGECCVMGERYRVPYVDLPGEYASMREELLAAVDAVFSRGAFILREEVTRLEQRLAERAGVAHAIGLGSGFDALHLGLIALGIGAGDEVIVPSYTFAASVSAIVRTGATPVFCDIGPDLNLDVQDLARRITSRTRAIMPVHLSGRPCDLDALHDLARTHTLNIIEDAAQAIGSTHRQRWLGSVGQVGCFSLHPLKTLSVGGDGGILLCHDDTIAHTVRTLRDHGRDPDHPEKQITMMGVNSRLDTLHAAVANLKLDRLPRMIQERQRVVDGYRRALSGLPSLRLLDAPPHARVAWSTFPVIVDAPSLDVAALVAGLRAQGVEAFRHFETPVHRLPPFAATSTSLPRTEALCRNTLYLPLHPTVSSEQVRYVGNVLETLIS
ncbi:MAG: DegT/DnrJ/EryC1/StrS family aminotransferase [Magnetococcales bacterium]|nr:DegT/DnrJ/EryC1/StrS family aminotransferase [Magnetococcales bacterium]